MIGVALVYIVAPIDLVPEALLTIPGLMDDAAVAAWLIATLMGATTAYRTWGGEVSDPSKPSGWAADLGGSGDQAPTRPDADRIVVGEVVTS
jgi:uncharacterized membrane protein YkvA (DUF1232 family)